MDVEVEDGCGSLGRLLATSIVKAWEEQEG